MSDDIIRRSDALEALGEEPPVWCDSVEEIAERNQWRRDAESIKAVPALIRIPLLTCKDCEYWETGWSCGGALHYCPMVDGIHGPNFYCGYAEPRKDEYVGVIKKGDL